MKRVLSTVTEITSSKYWDYFILVARFLLGWTFLRYGYGKLTAAQFGIREEELRTPLQDLSLFRLSWYLFDHQPFKAVVGSMQVICGSLLMIHQTAIIGAFLFLPLVATVLIIDLTVMPYSFKVAFAWRLSFYFLLDLLILGHYQKRMKIIWKAVWQNVQPNFRYTFWAYAILPIMAILLEILGLLPKIMIAFLTNPGGTLKAIREIVEIGGQWFMNILH